MKNKTRGRQGWKEKKKDPPSVSPCFIRCTVQGGRKGGGGCPRATSDVASREEGAFSSLLSLSFSLWEKR